MACRLSHRKITTIGGICNLECPDLVPKEEALNSHGRKTIDDEICNKYCPMFKSLLCSGLLRGAKNFISAVPHRLEEAQVNKIYRMRLWYEINRYK